MVNKVAIKQYFMEHEIAEYESIEDVLRKFYIKIEDITFSFSGFKFGVYDFIFYFDYD